MLGHCSNTKHPGSYIGTKQELQQYVEDDETKKKKSKINEKIDKIKSILG